MRPAGLAVRRARAQAGPLLLLLVLVATIGAVCSGTLGYVRASSVATVHESLTTVPPAEGGVLVQTRLGEDPGAQQAALEAALADRFAGVPLDVTSTLRSEPVGAELDGGNPGGEEVDLVLATLPVDGGGLVTVTGSAPGAGEAVVPEPVATELGLAVGDTLDVDGTPVAVSGTWLPVDAQDRAWFDGPLSAGADAYGPVLVDEATLTDAVAAPFVRWTVYPDVTGLTVEDLAALTAGAEQLEVVLGREEAVAVRGLTVEGTLGATAARIADAAATAGTVGLVPVVLLAVISLIALVQVVRLLAQTRSSEVEILVARGADPAQVTRWAALEGAVVAVLGAGLGTVVATAVVAPLDGGLAQLPLVWAVGLVVAVAALVTAVAVAGLQVRALARRRVSDRSGRLQRAAALGTIVLTLVAAALAAWQLLRHGTPLVVTGEGDQPQVDVLAVAAPAAVLVALAVVALALLGPLARLAEHLATRRRSLAPALAARQVARQLRAYAVPVVLLVLAAGSVTAAAGFAGTAAAQREDVAALATGTDVRVDLPEGASSRGGFPTAASAAPYAQLDGVADAAIVLREQAVVGETEVALTALPAQRLGEVMRVPAGLDLAAADDDAAAADSLATAAGGIVLPEGATHLELDVRVRAAYPESSLEAAERQDEADRELLEAMGDDPQPVPDLAENLGRLAEEHDLSTAVWVADRDGALSQLDAGTLTGRLLEPGAADIGPEPTEHTLSVELPHPGDYRLVGLDLAATAHWLAAYELEYEVTGVRGIGADGAQPAEVPAAEWAPAEALSVELGEPEPVGALGVRAAVGAQDLGTRQSGEAFARLLPGTAQPVPAVISSALAQHLDLSAGDQFDAALAGPQVAMQVAGVVDAVPGGLEDHAVLADQATLGQQLLHARRTSVLPNQVWLSGTPDADVEEVAEDARELVGNDGEVEVAGAEVTDSTAPVTEAFWLAAAGSALLALTGVAAVALALVRRRRSEVMVLRALGQTPGAQARTRTGELLGVSALALILGVLAGWGTSVMLVPTLTRAAATTTSPLPLSLHMAPVPGALLVAAVLAGLLAVAAVVGARVRAQALDAEYREEIR